jgi:anti-sigma regulatory factor (Ser/Thr protein kinase)
MRALALDPTARRNLELLVSELVANSIRHAGLTEQDPISIHVTARSDRVRVSVRDSGPGFETPPVDGGNPLVPGGQGYVIIEALSDAWGIDSDENGCTVWCEIKVDERWRDAIDREVTDAYVGHLGTQLVPAPD